MVERWWAHYNSNSPVLLAPGYRFPAPEAWTLETKLAARWELMSLHTTTSRFSSETNRYCCYPPPKRML